MNSPDTLPEDKAPAPKRRAAVLPKALATAFARNLLEKSLEEKYLSIAPGLSDDEVLTVFPEAETIYDRAFAAIESEAAASNFPDDLLELQTELYREFEKIASRGPEERHHFFIVIPVADRPLLVRNCLESLLDQCRAFGYGGMSATGGGPPFHRKIEVYIFDDSKNPANSEEIRELAGNFSASGLRTHYTGKEEQDRVLKQLGPELHEKLSRVLGRGSLSGHKGASITRNIASLYLNAVLNSFQGKALVYFIDSDEEFRVTASCTGGAKIFRFINYFYRLDKIFTELDIEVLTGKVVGDPPLSPSVMVNTFLDDVLLFLDSVSTLDPAGPCAFHSSCPQDVFSAEYHDMKDLFGYDGKDSKKYSCDLSGPHRIMDCFDDFSVKAKGFFFGFHPTRPEYYRHESSFSAEPARTVYTGNFLVTREGLRHFIPFADLKLRMAGPTLGRILKTRIGGRFVSAATPLLHNRTIGRHHWNEFRNGISDVKGAIDIREEYRNQFWGDVMLFSVERLAVAGFPLTSAGHATISEIVEEVQKNLLEIYTVKNSETILKISLLKSHIHDSGAWWNRIEAMRDAVGNLAFLLSSAEYNFGESSPGFGNLVQEVREGRRKVAIIESISSFQEDDYWWNEALKVPISIQH